MTAQGHPGNSKQVEQQHGAYSYTLGASVGAALFRGLNGCISNVKIMQNEVMVTIAYQIYATVKELERIKAKELAAQKKYIAQIEKDKGNQSDVSIDIQEMNGMKAIFNNAEQKATLRQNQETQIQQQLPEEIGKLISNLRNILELFQGLTN